MIFKAFKVSQYSETYKELLEKDENFEIFVTSLSIYDLRKYVYVKTVKDYSKESDAEVIDKLGGGGGYKEYVDTVKITDITQNEDSTNVEVNETQREKKYEKLISIGEYIKNELGIFPTAILLGTKPNASLQFTSIDNNLVEVNLDNNSLQSKEGLFIIDGQHRIYGVMTYLLKKLLDKYKELLPRELSMMIDRDKEIDARKYLDKIFTIIGEEEMNSFIESNRFDFPTVIIHKLPDKKKALLFADINSTATKLDSNLGTWIYGKTDIQKRYIKIFVELGENLNKNKNSALFHRFKIPSDKTENKLSKIGIKPFVDNSLNMLQYTNRGRKLGYNSKPFNILLDVFLKNNSEISEDAVTYISNALSIVYFIVFYNSRKVFGQEKWNNKEYGFINTNNLGLYLYMVKISFLTLYGKHKEDLFSLILKDGIIDDLNAIFNNIFKEPLEETYKYYSYFQKGKTEGSSASQENKVVRYFKAQVFKLDEELTSKKFNLAVSEKEQKLMN